MKTDKKRRREPGFSLLANLLQKDVRTLHRWITKRPQLRRVLRAKRYGKQWRIDYPKTQAAFDRWIEKVRKAVSPFTRTPDRTAKGKFAQRVCNELGFGDGQRERDIDLLRHAMLLKRTDAVRYVAPHEDEQFYADLDGETNPNLPANNYQEWESEAACYWSTARMVSAQFNCRVQDVPTYWREFCRRHREQNRNLNVPTCNWLNAHGLYERAMQLLPNGSGDLIALRWKFNKDPRSREMYFSTQHLQLLPVVSDAEIDAECARMLELWPEPPHWQRAKKHREKEWQLETLAEAAFELAKEEKPITGANLSRLLFRNPTVQDMWKLHQEHLKLRKRGIEIFCDEAEIKGRCNYGKRGISLREFRQRYTKNEIKEATTAARKADASDINRGSRSDDGEAVVEREVLEKMMRPGETSQQFIDQAWAAKYRRQIANNLEIKNWLAGLTGKDRETGEQTVSDPFSDKS